MRLLFVCLLTFLVEISDSALRDSFTKHSWWHVWIFLLIFRRSGTHSSCQVPGLYADWSVVCSVHHSAATFFLLGGWNLVCEVVVLMHANTVWLFIKRQTFLAASVTQNMSVPPAQQVYCPAVKHKSELHPGFVLLFWCFFHEWDGYIVNGFFSVLTVFTVFYFWICVRCRFRVCTWCFILKIDRMLCAIPVFDIWPGSICYIFDGCKMKLRHFTSVKNRLSACSASRSSTKTQLNHHLISIAVGLRDTFVHLTDDNTWLEDLYLLRLPVGCQSVKDLNLSSTAAVVKPWPWAERLWCSSADAAALESNFNKGVRDYRVNV